MQFGVVVFGDDAFSHDMNNHRDMDNFLEILLLVFCVFLLYPDLHRSRGGRTLSTHRNCFFGAHLKFSVVEARSQSS